MTIPAAMLEFLLLVMAPQAVEITVSEPFPARYSRQSATFRCGRDVLEISGYGAARPEGRPPRVRWNGRMPAGTSLPALLRDLAHPRAVYRFAASCNSDGRPGLWLKLNWGEPVSDTEVQYYRGSAYFVGARLRSYWGFRAYPESFWSY